MRQRKVVALVQQRMGSERFPGKAVADVAGKPLTVRLFERLNRAKTLDEILIILPKEPNAGVLTDTIKDLPFRVFDLPHWDLVARHWKAAQLTKADVIVRVPGDNPCVDPDEVDRMVHHYLDQPVPTGQWLYTNLDQDVLGNDYPGGVGCEVYSAWFLQWLYMNGTYGKPAYREHPHLWAFDLNRLRTIPAPWKGGARYKFSVDTEDDLAMVNALYKRCPPDFTTYELLNFLGALPNGQSTELWRTSRPGPTRSWHTNDAAQGGGSDAGDGPSGDGVPGDSLDGRGTASAGQPHRSAASRALAAIRGH